MTEEKQGASGKPDRAGGPSDLSRCASQPEALIPSALALAAAEDLIALAEESYVYEAGLGDPEIDDACCTTTDGLCGWKICERAGCVIDKYHRGLALQTAAILAAQGMPPAGPRREGGSGASAPASPVGNADAPEPSPDSPHHGNIEGRDG